MGIIRLKHYDDRKGKEQSHEVSMSEKDSDGEYLDQFDSIYGFGATKEEAFADYIAQFDLLMDQYQQFRKNIRMENMIEI